MTDTSAISRGEAFWVLGIWGAFAVWVLGYAALYAFPQDPSTAVTISFCLFVMKDEAK